VPWPGHRGSSSRSTCSVWVGGIDPCAAGTWGGCQAFHRSRRVRGVFGLECIHSPWSCITDSEVMQLSQFSTRTLFKMFRLQWVLGASLLACACYDSHHDRAKGSVVSPDCSVADGGCERADASAVSPVCGHISAPEPEPCDPNDAACAPPGRQALYQSCSGSSDECGDEPNTKCAAYTQLGKNLFCAAYCEDDSACPTLPGFKAACNLAWCALLCNHGACPDGMICIADFPFKDCAGRDRGLKSVCVPAD
jgi:hypothetical protein